MFFCRIRKKFLVMFLVFILSAVMIVPEGFGISVHAAAILENREDFVLLLYETLANRQNEVKVEYQGSDSETIYADIDKVLFGEVAEFHELSSTDDVDYICGNLARYKCTYIKKKKGSEFVFEFSYHESASQTKIVNERVKDILHDLNLEGLTDYEKVKKIHDFIIETVSYDKDCQRYSAYCALEEKSSVCNGYALLAYKMLTFANIPCKYVAGFVDEDNKKQEHAWNLVKLDGKWYNMDVTWDDTDKEGEISYQYFLKGDTEFSKNHIRNSRYNYPLFQILYPVSESNYDGMAKTKISFSLKDISLSFKKKTLKKGKKISLTVKNKSTEKIIKKVTFKSTKSKIASVSSKGRISAKKRGRADIKTTVSLTDGQKKTFTVKITVK